MAVPDADPQNLEQLPPQDAEQPVGAAGLLTATAERAEDMVHPGRTGDAPPVGPAAKDNALPDRGPEQPGGHAEVCWALPDMGTGGKHLLSLAWAEGQQTVLSAAHAAATMQAG